MSPLSQLARRRESTYRQLLFSRSVEDACGLRRRAQHAVIQGEPCCARNARSIDAEELAQSGTGIAAPKPVRS
jgi:hypothetical protein